MLLPCHAWVPCGLFVVFGLSLPAASSQEAIKPPKTKRTTAEPVARQLYAAHGSAVKVLANTLSLYFQAEPSFQVVPDAGSKTLLLSGRKAVLDEALTMLREIDPPARTIHLEVLFVALASTDTKALDGVELSGPARDVKARIRELHQKGVIATVKTIQITTMEGESTRSQVSESRPFVTGVPGFAGGGFGGRGGGAQGAGAGPMTRSISYREVGTNVQVKADLSGDGPVSLELRFEDSHMRPAEEKVAADAEDKGASVPATEVITSTLETRLRVRPGHMVIAQGTKTMSKSGQAQTIILVTVSTDEASKDNK